MLRDSLRIDADRFESTVQRARRELDLLLGGPPTGVVRPQEPMSESISDGPDSPREGSDSSGT